MKIHDAKLGKERQYHITKHLVYSFSVSIENLKRMHHLYNVKLDLIVSL